MREDYENLLDFSESSEKSWRSYLSDFQKDVWPVFQEYGFTSMEMALHCWMTNSLTNDISKLLDKLEESL